MGRGLAITNSALSVAVSVDAFVALPQELRHNKAPRSIVASNCLVFITFKDGYEFDSFILVDIAIFRVKIV